MRCGGSVLALALIFALLPVTVHAEEETASGQWYFVLQEVVKPGMVVDYEAAVRDSVTELKKHELESSSFKYIARTTSDMVYSYALPIEGYAGLDRIGDEIAAAVQKVGADRWMMNASKTVAAVDHSNEYIVQHRPDLSYAPEKPAVTPEETRFELISLYYAVPSKTQELEMVAKDYAALFKEKNISQEFQVYERLSGSDLPVYVVIEPAKNEADFYARAAEIQESLGEEGKRLRLRTLPLIRKHEMTHVWLRPDLSYWPED